MGRVARLSRRVEPRNAVRPPRRCGCEVGAKLRSLPSPGWIEPWGVVQRGRAGFSRRKEVHLFDFDQCSSRQGGHFANVISLRFLTERPERSVRCDLVPGPQLSRWGSLLSRDGAGKGTPPFSVAGPERHSPRSRRGCWCGGRVGCGRVGGGSRVGGAATNSRWGQAKEKRAG